MNKRKITSYDWDAVKSRLFDEFPEWSEACEAEVEAMEGFKAAEARLHHKLRDVRGFDCNQALGIYADFLSAEELFLRSRLKSGELVPFGRFRELLQERAGRIFELNSNVADVLNRLQSKMDEPAGEDG